MAVLKPRNRVLIFRLTQDEYQTLRSACASNGARSLSEFARSHLLAALVNGVRPREASGVEEKLTELHDVLARLARLIESAQGAAALLKATENALPPRSVVREIP